MIEIITIIFAGMLKAERDSVKNAPKRPIFKFLLRDPWWVEDPNADWSQLQKTLFSVFRNGWHCFEQLLVIVYPYSAIIGYLEWGMWAVLIVPAVFTASFLISYHGRKLYYGK